MQSFIIFITIVSVLGSANAQVLSLDYFSASNCGNQEMGLQVKGVMPKSCQQLWTCYGNRDEIIIVCGPAKPVGPVYSQLQVTANSKMTGYLEFEVSLFNTDQCNLKDWECNFLGEPIGSSTLNVPQFGQIVVTQDSAEAVSFMEPICAHFVAATPCKG
eukprot:ANDGO_06348.mRNA.1 hypothetical protein